MYLKQRKIIFILFLCLFSCSLQAQKEQSLDAGKPSEKKDIRKEKQMRILDELINTNDSAFPILEELISTATNGVEVLPRDAQKAEECLLACQVTTRSFMGAIIYHTGGILIDGGWLRILGSGNKRMTRSIASWNKDKSYTESMAECAFLLIADDAIGGFFAINAGALGSEIGNVYYFAPDTLEWEDLGISYSDFITFALSGNLAQFYETFRWEGWANDVRNLSPDQAYTFVPFLWTKEGENINDCSRATAPMSEVYGFNVDMSKKLN